MPSVSNSYLGEYPNSDEVNSALKLISPIPIDDIKSESVNYGLNLDDLEYFLTYTLFEEEQMAKIMEYKNQVVIVGNDDYAILFDKLTGAFFAQYHYNEEY